MRATHSQSFRVFDISYFNEYSPTLFLETFQLIQKSGNFFRCKLTSVMCWPLDFCVVTLFAASPSDE